MTKRPVAQAFNLMGITDTAGALSGNGARKPISDGTSKTKAVARAFGNPALAQNARVGRPSA